MNAPRVKLRKPLERAISGGHPWVFRDALQPFEAPLGSPVTVCSRGGAFVARGYAGAGPIAVRVLTTRDEPVNDGLLARRIEQAAALRRLVLPPDTNAYRLLHGEGDRLPGFVCDVYDEHAVVKLDGEGARALFPRLRPALLAQLSALGVHTVIERRGRGEQRSARALRGTLPDAPVCVLERGMRLWVDLVSGQKTGTFLDHRESRATVGRLAGGLRVLNLYSYTGGFSVAAALGGATAVTSVDVAAGAIALSERNAQENGIAKGVHAGQCSDVMAYLAGSDAPFDLVIADPPSFAPNAASVARARQSYAALHAAALSRVTEGGLYLAASCSSHIDRALFEQDLQQGARQAGRLLQVLERTGAPADHPRPLGFPEGDYLKVTLCRVLSGKGKGARAR